MKISIITVTYNSIEHIDDCLSSIQAQSHSDVEHIIIDGASNDGTLSFLKSKNKQLKTIISEPDDGIYDAMNKGIKVADGDIIGFLNSDDIYAANSVLSSVDKIFKEDKNLESCYSDLVYVDPKDTNKIKRYVRPGTFLFGAFSKGWCPPHPTFFVKRSVYQKYGVFNLDYKLGSDAELMMRFLEVKKIKVKYIPQIWVKFRVGGISNRSFKNILKQNHTILKALKKHNLKSNFIVFIINKLIIKIKEFYKRPNI